jgi:hypothetical protein
MENEISNEYIENAINELEKFFGVKEPVFSENIFSLIRGGKVKEAMKLIALQLGLPIDINITNVPNDYRAQSGDNQFHSTHLVKVHQHGSGSEGITAQVTIPGSLPFYGSSALNGYPINVKISKNCTEHPVVFAMIMAHELSHILLYSLSHSKKENEFYTDLTAIMLGFQNIFQNGRKITKTNVEQGFMSTTTRTQTTTYGYLNDNQFYFAHNKINSILEKNRERKKLLLGEFKRFAKLLSKYEKTLFKFKNFLEYLTKNTNKKISGEDGKKMMSFFQPGYMDDLSLVPKEYNEKQLIIEKFLKELFHYTDQRVNQLSAYTNSLKTYINELKVKLIPLKKDVGMLKKYVNYKYRIKVFFSLLFKGGKK